MTAQMQEDADSFFTWFDQDNNDLETGETIHEDLWKNPLAVYVR